MTNYSREYIYENNGISGWRDPERKAPAYWSNGGFRNAGTGNGARSFGHVEDGLPMGASSYIRIDTSNATNWDNCIAQDQVPMTIGEEYTIGIFARGKGRLQLAFTQEGYKKLLTEVIDQENWRLFTATTTAKAESQSVFFYNASIETDDYAGALDLCAPMIFMGGVEPMIISTATITVAKERDIASVWNFYQLSTSTTAPAAPTEAQGQTFINTTPKPTAIGNWKTTEPSYTSGSTNFMYVTELTAFTDGTVSWSLVSKSASYEAAKLAYNEAQNAKDVINNVAEGINSRGEQLVVNGSASLNDNTNFSAWDYDGSEANASGGSFTKTADSYYVLVTDEFFPIDAGKAYTFEFDMKSKLRSGKMYSFLLFCDIDKNPIMAPNHMYVANTLTTLAQDLKTGDTVVHLSDLTNWNVSTGSASYMRGFIFWDYKNSFGYTYPEHTYSRNYHLNLYTDANVNKSAKTITLSAPWSKSTIPAGTKVSQSGDGANYKYCPLTDSIVPTSWTHYKGRYEGTDYSGKNVPKKFPPGTAYAKVGFAWNYRGTGNGEQFWLTNVAVYIDTIAEVSSYKKINCAAKAYTTAQWKTYGAAGNKVNWGTGADYDNSDLRVGDTAYITGTVTDEAGGSAIIVGTVNSISETAVNMTSQQLIFNADAVSNVNTKATAAATTATSYLTDLSNGVYVHAEGTSDDPTTTSAKGVRITDNVDIIRKGKVVASYGEEAVIGKPDGSRVIINPVSIIGVDQKQHVSFQVTSSGTPKQSTVTIPARMKESTDASGCKAYPKLDELNNGDTFNVGFEYYIENTSGQYIAGGWKETSFKKGTYELTGVTGSTVVSSGGTSSEPIELVTYQYFYDEEGDYVSAVISAASGYQAYILQCIVYYNATTFPPHFTFGTRPPTENQGDYSAAIGENNTASGEGSMAIGKELITTKNGQIVLGQYNIADSRFIFIFGEGQEPIDGVEQRRNAIGLTPGGDMLIEGDIYFGCGDDLRSGTQIKNAAGLSYTVTKTF